MRPHGAPSPGPRRVADVPLALSSFSPSSVVCTGWELCTHRSVWLSVQLFRWLVCEGRRRPRLTVPVAELTLTVGSVLTPRFPTRKLRLTEVNTCPRDLSVISVDSCLPCSECVPRPSAAWWWGRVASRGLRAKSVPGLEWLGDRRPLRALFPRIRSFFTIPPTRPNPLKDASRMLQKPYNKW